MDHYNHALQIIGAFISNHLAIVAAIIVGGIILAELLRRSHERRTKAGVAIALYIIGWAVAIGLLVHAHEQVVDVETKLQSHVLTK